MGTMAASELKRQWAGWWPSSSKLHSGTRNGGLRDRTVRAIGEMWRSRKLLGHYAYYGVTGNYRSIENFRRQVRRTWRRWLNRRSRDNSMPWERYVRILRYYRLPPARIVHSFSAATL